MIQKKYFLVEGLSGHGGSGLLHCSKQLSEHFQNPTQPSPGIYASHSLSTAGPFHISCSTLLYLSQLLHHLPHFQRFAFSIISLLYR